MKSVLALLFAIQLHAAWDPKAAAGYLDNRATWWSGWKSAARDHDTFCISCHTSLPYLLGRPALRSTPNETPTAAEQRIIDNITKRVRIWGEAEPFYKGAKAVESRGTEAGMNALLLVSFDARAGKFGEGARTALDHMLALQEKSGDLAGSLPWMNFHFQPWEDEGSRYWGATVTALALGSAPADYRQRPGVRESIDLLRGYLARQAPSQTLFNRASLLWASSRLPGVLSDAQRESIVREISKQQAADGGWTAASLLPADWKRRDATPLEAKSDGYATAFLTFVLGTAGHSDVRGKRWLEANQDHETGAWPAWSMNKQRDPASDAGKFMSDAATAFAALALAPKAIDSRIRVLIIDGINNHDWQTGTRLMRGILERQGGFAIDVSTTPAADASPEAWAAWRPDFSRYQVVINNFNGGHLDNGVRWPGEVEKALEEYVRGGGGLVVFHAANNAFLHWPAYNEMIGLGWRAKTIGRGIAIGGDGRPVVIPQGEGTAPGHPAILDFELHLTAAKHPITAGLPPVWMHPHEQLTHGQHGPAEGLTILTYAASPVTKLNEPMDWVREYGKGRVYTTMLGHTWKNEANTSNFEDPGFQTLFLRGVEWAATGRVTIPVKR